MQPRLPKSNNEYKTELKKIWDIDIDKEELKGIYTPSKTNHLGFLSNCCTLDGRQLKYPDNNLPLRILIHDNPLNTLQKGKAYRFKVSLDTSVKRVAMGNPYLLITQPNSIYPSEVPLTAIGSITENNSELSEVLREIFREKMEQNNPFNVIDMAEAVEALAIDIYSDNKRFIYELIQNADDAATVEQSELLIEINSGFVVLSHNGKPFDEKDLRGLCGVGRGTKRDDETSTGYKGIGFKSVFGQPEGLVYIKTSGLLFRFDRQYMLQYGWNKAWGNQKEWEAKHSVKFKSPWQLVPLLSASTRNAKIDELLNAPNFTVKTAIKIQKDYELASDIEDLFSDARSLLFLRRIYKITLVHYGKSICIRKESTSDDTNVLTLYSNNQLISSWYVRTNSYEIPQHVKDTIREDVKSPKKLQELKKADISFAFKLQANLKSLDRLPANESQIFTYLPTAVTEFGFPFLVNSNFLVDAGREKLHKDRVWNKWLFNVIGYELINRCAEFSMSENYRSYFLTMLLPNYLPDNDPLMKAFNDGIKKGISTIAFIPNRKNILVKAKDVVIDETGILEQHFTNTVDIADFINASNTDKINPENILPASEEFGKLLTYGAMAFRQRELKAFMVSANLLDNHIIENNVHLLIFLQQLDEKDKSGEWNSIIRSTPFIFTNHDKLEKIPLVCFPITTYTTEFGSENTLINNQIYAEISTRPTLIAWLKTMEVKEPSEIAYLEQEIIGKIDQVITNHNYKQITEFILGMHIGRKLQEKHYQSLRNLPVKSSTGFTMAKECFLPAMYKPTLDISALIDVKTVSLDYMGRYNAFEWRDFFVSIDVADDINVIPNYEVQSADNLLPTTYFNDAASFGRDGHVYGHLVQSTKPAYITYFTSFIKTINYNYAYVFWDRLISKYTLSTSPQEAISDYYSKNREIQVYTLNNQKLKSIDFMNWGYYPTNRVAIPSFIFWYLKNEKIIPITNGTCMKASEVFTNSERITELGGNYLSIIKVSKELTKEWVQLLGLRVKPGIKDCLDILKNIYNDTNNYGFVKKENIKRIGLVYNELISYIDDMNSSDEKTIKDWANIHRFVCNDMTSAKNSQVVWLKVSGFNEQNSKIPTILMPPNVVPDERTEQLFQIFGIKVISSCDYQIKEEREDQDLMTKVFEFIPALSLILRSKMLINSEEEYLASILEKLKDFKFFSCKEISLVLRYQNAELEGATVKYYISKVGFYSTTNWRSAIERYNTSSYLADILKCGKAKQEIQLLLELSRTEIYEYLDLVGIDSSTLIQTSIYALISEKIKELQLPGTATQLTYLSHHNGSSKATSIDRNNTAITASLKEIVVTHQEEVEDFIRAELENTEWAEYIPELKRLLGLSTEHVNNKQQMYNLVAKIRLSRSTNIHFDKADKDYNQLSNGIDKYFVHSARGTFAYIHPNEILSMRDDGYKMALDFGFRHPVKIYQSAEEILGLNTNHLLAYQHEKTMDDLFLFCQINAHANKHLLIIDGYNAKMKSNEIFKLLNPEDDYQ